MDKNILLKKIESIDTCDFFNSIILNSEALTFFILDKEGFIIGGSAGIYNSYGYSPEEIIGRHFSELFTEEDRKKGIPQEELTKALNEGSASDYNYLLHKTGLYVWTQGETISVKDPEGKVYFIKSITNINQQKILENQLINLEVSDVVVEHFKDPLVVVDNEMEIVKANKAFYDFFDLVPGQNKTRSFFETIKNYPGDSQELRQLLDQLLPENVEVKELETVYNFPLKGKRIVSINVSKVDYGKEKRRTIIIYFKDITLQREESEALKKTFKNTQLILETLPQIAYTVLPDGSVSFLNKKWEEYTGQSVREGTDHGWEKIIHPDDLEGIRKIREIDLKKGEDLEFEFRILRGKDKMYRWHVARVKPVVNENNAVLMWIGTSLDIHDRKISNEETVKNLETILLESQEQGKVGSVEWDKAANKLSFTPVICSTFGYDVSQILKLEDLIRRVHPKDIAELRNAFRQSIEQKKEISHAFRILLPDGTVKHLLTRGKVHVDDSGKLSRYVGIIIDISERKKYEEEIEKTKSLLLETESLTHCGSFEADLIHDTVIYTPELYRLYGLKEGTPVNTRTYRQYIHPGYKEKVVNLLQHLIDNGGQIEIEYKVMRKDNTERCVLGKAKMIRNEDQQPVKILGILHDITDRKKTEEELMRVNAELEYRVKRRTEELIQVVEDLKQANSDLDTFVYTASHDLKAPIANVEGLIQSLRQELGETLEQQEGIKTIFDLISLSIEKFRETLRDLATIGKAQAEAQGNRTWSSVAEVLESVMLELKSQIETSSASVECECTGAPSIRISQKNLKSILYNLVSNAIKYKSPERDPVIRIRSEVTDSKILLSVSDNGLGIKEEDKEKVFSMYKRLHNHVEGTGVGMAIVKRIVDNNHGRIEIQSEVGKGTTFNIYFRIEKEEQ